MGAGRHMSEVFEYQRRVEFRDTDMAGIVHFSVFFAYMEEAEHAFLKSLGLAVFSEHGGQEISWPRVAAQCNYRSAIRFEDELVIQLSVQRIGGKSVTYHHEIRSGENLVADGTITTVCCEIEHGKRPQSIAIPDHFVNAFKPYATQSQ